MIAIVIVAIIVVVIVVIFCVGGTVVGLVICAARMECQLLVFVKI